MMIILSEGKALGRLNRFEDAIRILDIALGTDPGNGEVLFEKGMALAHLRRHEEAEEAFGESAAALPDRYEPLYRRGLSLMSLCRYADAVAVFDAALGSAQKIPDIWYQKGLALAKSGTHGWGINRIRPCPMQCGPVTWTLSLNGDGCSPHSAGTDDAAESFDRVIEHSPRHAAAWYEKGLASVPPEKIR